MFVCFAHAECVNPKKYGGAPGSGGAGARVVQCTRKVNSHGRRRTAVGGGSRTAVGSLLWSQRGVLHSSRHKAVGKGSEPPGMT